MMREGTVRKLHRSSLVLVLCQVRFAPLEALENYVPEIQDRLRRAGFPRSESTTLLEIPSMGSASVPGTRKIWEFQNRERSVSIVLDKTFLTLQTTSYNVFEDFLETLTGALDIVSEVVDGLFVSRVGVRYGNVIRPGEGECWKEYIREGLRGFESDLFTAGTELNLHQTVAHTDAGIIALRLFQNRHAGILPPDLEGQNLEPPAGFEDVESGELLTLLDVDHSRVTEFDYTRSSLEELAWKLKNRAHQITFEHVVTEHAINKWS
ncbi:MAG: TIGR04255 family protein [Bradymonadaceae bacterium]